jgi:hypothetical protein
VDPVEIGRALVCLLHSVCFGTDADAVISSAMFDAQTLFWKWATPITPNGKEMEVPILCAPPFRFDLWSYLFALRVCSGAAHGGS